MLTRTFRLIAESVLQDTFVLFYFSMSSGFKVPPIKYLPVADREKMLADVVIVSWCSIVEELVLNAVDAGAKNVKIWSVVHQILKQLFH